MIGALVLSAASLYLKSVNSNLMIGEVLGYSSNETKTIGNMSVNIELSNGTTLNLMKEIPVTKCGPGSVWEALGLC